MIRTALFSLTLTLFLGNIYAQGVNFEQLEYDEVVEKAKNESKLIFVDVYTDWCAPCRKMDKEVFPNKELGAYMSEHFVSYKADGSTHTGKMLARKYGVGSYPHYLFLDTKGNLIYKVRGFMTSEKLIDEARVAADPGSLNQYKLYKKKYNAGNRDQDLLKSFLKLGKKRYKEVDPEVFDAYFATLDLMDKQNEEHLMIVATHVPFADGRAYDLAKDYYYRLSEDTGNTEVVVIAENLVQAVDNSLAKLCEEKLDNGLEDLLSKKEELLFQLQPTDTLENAKIVELARVRHYGCIQDTSAYKEWSQRFVEAFLWDDDRFHKDTTEAKGIAQTGKDMNDAAILAEFADNYPKFFKDEKSLYVAESWVSQAIRWDDKLDYHITKAFVVDAIGDKREAVAIAARAYERARKENSDQAPEIQRALMTIVDGEQKKKGVK